MGLEKELKHNEPEGATPIEDISGLKLPHDITRRELFDAEFESCTDATEDYLVGGKKIKEFTRESLFNVHKAMFGAVWQWGGSKRKSDTQIGVAHYIIEEQLKQLFDDLAYWEKQKMDSVEIAVRLHHKLVWIHPFPNGNGRWARLVANIYLHQKTKQIFHWPEQQISQTSEFRNQYLKALKKADTLDYKPLLKLHMNIIETF